MLVERVVAGMSEGLAYCIVLVGPDLRAQWVSPSCRRLLGWRPEELVGRSPFDLIHPDDVESVVTLATLEQSSPSAWGDDPATLVGNVVRLRHADGTWRPLELMSNNQLDNPEVRAFIVMLRDASTEHHTVEVLRRLATGAPVHDVLGAVVDLLLSQIDGAGVTITVHDAAGLPLAVADGAWGDGPAGIVVPIDHPGPPSELAVWVPGGEPSLWCRTIVARAAHLVRLALTRERGESELRRAAHTDPLTGVRNRAGLDAHLAQLSAGAWGGQRAVLYVDLDDFKLVNDDLGHAAGDAVLTEVAHRLRTCLRADDVLARPGGDEFVAVCADLPDADLARRLADRIVHALEQPVALDGGPVRCTASVGVAVGSSQDVAGLLGRADAALLRAKRAGKSCVVVDAV